MQGILPRFDLIVGTEEEFLIAGGGEDLLTALRTVRSLTAATLVVKLAHKVARSFMAPFRPALKTAPFTLVSGSRS